jgi:thiol-disulfide isomerase/thioredoxin
MDRDIVSKAIAGILVAVVVMVSVVSAQILGAPSCDYCMTYSEARELSLAHKKPLVVLLTSDSCVLCKPYTAKVKELVREERIAFCIVNISEASNVFVSQLVETRDTPQLLGFSGAVKESGKLIRKGVLDDEQAKRFFKALRGE